VPVGKQVIGRPVTRRTFLAIAAVSGVAGLLPQWSHSTGCWCRAVVRAAHEHDGRRYCPNCGRDALENRFRLVGGTRGDEWSLGRWFRNGPSPVHVPFPNLHLVKTTDKAAAVMSKVRLQGVLDLSSAQAARGASPRKT
jgi:hypothetical protein